MTLPNGLTKSARQYQDVVRPIFVTKDTAYAITVRRATEGFISAAPAFYPMLARAETGSLAEVWGAECELIADTAAVDIERVLGDEPLTVGDIIKLTRALVQCHNHVKELAQPASQRHNMRRAHQRIIYWLDWSIWNAFDAYLGGTVTSGSPILSLATTGQLGLRASRRDMEFILHRRPTDQDQLGPFRPADVPCGWQSNEYPSRWDEVGLQKWIDFARERVVSVIRSR